jgi:uncharacterized Zn finger protein
MDEKVLLGCDECRRGAYSGTWPPPKQIATREDGPSFLHRCEKCGTFWDFTIRFANPITEAEAKRLYNFVTAKEGQ